MLPTRPKLKKKPSIEDLHPARVALISGNEKPALEFIASLPVSPDHFNASLFLLSACLVKVEQTGPEREEELARRLRCIQAAQAHRMECDPGAAVHFLVQNVRDLIAIDHGPAVAWAIESIASAKGAPDASSHLADMNANEHSVEYGYFWDAISANAPSALSALMRCGVHPNHDNEWASALTINRVPLLHILMEWGLDVHQPPPHGVGGPGHRWVALANTEFNREALAQLDAHPALDFLVENGFDMHQSFEPWKTPMEYAIDEGRPDIAELIKKTLARFEAKKIDASTPLPKGSQTTRRRI